MDRFLCHHIFSASVQSIIRKKNCSRLVWTRKTSFHSQKKKGGTSIIAITKAQRTELNAVVRKEGGFSVW